MQEFFFNTITHTVANIFLFSSMVYSLVLCVLKFFKRKALMKRIVPKCIYDDGSWGIFAVLGILFGLVGLLDTVCPYKSDHDVFLSVAVIYTVFAFVGLITLFVFVKNLHDKIPEE